MECLRQECRRARERGRTALGRERLIRGDHPPLTASPDEAECFARGVVGSIGSGRLNDLGVTVGNVGDIDDFAWTEGEAETIVDKMFDCTDALAEFSENIAEGASDEQAACVADSFDEDAIKGFLVSTFTGEEPDLAVIFEVLSTCGVDAFG